MVDKQTNKHRADGEWLTDGNDTPVIANHSVRAHEWPACANAISEVAIDWLLWLQSLNKTGDIRYSTYLFSLRMVT